MAYELCVVICSVIQTGKGKVMKSVSIVVLLLAVSHMAFADITENYGWEGTDTILGMYPVDGIIATIATDQVHGGTQSLYLVDDLASGTPQAFVALITGLLPGDSVSCEFWRYDEAPGASPSCRIWAHWISDPDDINSHTGSAGGNDEYGPGGCWDLTSWKWGALAGQENLVIEVRTYSSPEDSVWVDDMTIIAPDHATICLPGYLALESSTWADIKAAF